MLKNIFLFKGKTIRELKDLNIFSYPEEIIKITDKDLIKKIIFRHDHANGAKKTPVSKINSKAPKKPNKTFKNYSLDEPISQVSNKLNIYSSCIDEKIIIGLILEKEDNPYDYKDIFSELINELVNVEKCCEFEDEIEIENFLITLFIDIRRFGEEFVKKAPQFELHYQDNFVKVFLFGIDEVGKSSLVRRLKTGEFDDNYFAPTRKFTIDYIQKEQSVLAIWDMPGQEVFRKKWLIGLQDSNIIIFMIDIANQLRFEESKREFWKIIERYELEGVPLLILGNKADLIAPSSENFESQLERVKKEVSSFFDFEKIANRKWQFNFTSVKTNFNITPVMNTIFELTA